MNTLKPYDEFVNEGFLGLDKLANMIKGLFNKKEKPTKTELKDDLTNVLLKSQDLKCPFAA